METNIFSKKRRGGLDVRTFQDGSKAFKMKMGWMLLACGAAYRIPKKRRKSEVTPLAKWFENVTARPSSAER